MKYKDRVKITPRKRYDHKKHEEIKEKIVKLDTLPINRVCKGCEREKAIERFAHNGKYFLYTCKPCQNRIDRERMAKRNARLKKEKEAHVS